MNLKNDVNPDKVENLVCPIRHTLDVVGGKWKLPIICMLAEGIPTRYNVIKKRLGGITAMVLSQSLKDLEATGIICRKQYEEIPPRVEYSLTEKGRSIVPMLFCLAEWGENNMQDRECNCGKCSSMK